MTDGLDPKVGCLLTHVNERHPRTTPGLPAVVRLRFGEVLYSADQPPSEGRTAPLMLVLSSLSRSVMDAASCAAVAGVGAVACIGGPRRSAASCDPQVATMLVMVGPGPRR